MVRLLYLIMSSPHLFREGTDSGLIMSNLKGELLTRAQPSSTFAVKQGLKRLLPISARSTVVDTIVSIRRIEGGQGSIVRAMEMLNEARVNVNKIEVLLRALQKLQSL